MPFTKYGFSAELLRGIKELGFKNPTPIQEQALPAALEGRDVLACAMTGSGKSAAFGLPTIERLGNKAKGFTRALVLTPTRELAAQIDEHLNALAVHTPVSSAAIYGFFLVVIALTPLVSDFNPLRRLFGSRRAGQQG